jgi:cytochrome P450
MSSDAGVDPGSEGDEQPDPADLPRPPGPGGLPLVGQTVAIARRPLSVVDERFCQHGDVVGYTSLGMRWTMLLHPDHVQQVLFDDWDRLERYFFDEFGGDLAAEGLFFAQGEQWSRQRAILQDAFTMDRLGSYADAMTTFAAERAERWDDGETVAVDEAMGDLTLRILTRSLLDVDVAERGDVVTEYARTVNERQQPSNPLSFLPLWVPTPENRRFKRRERAFESFVDDLVEQRRGASDEYDDLLWLMLTETDDEGRGLSDREVRDQLITFLFAGHETTALGLTYTLLSVASDEAVRERLDEELSTVLDGRHPRVSDLPDLSYTEQVVQEALRRYPPAYILFRRATEDLAVGGYRVPEGTRVTIPTHHLHHDERFWDDPGAFRPERWSEDDPDRPECAYLPFGAGPRHCIGMRFAMMELKLVLATLLQRLAFEPVSDPDPELAPGVTLQPADAVRLRVHER